MDGWVGGWLGGLGKREAIERALPSVVRWNYAVLFNFPR